MIKLSKGSSPSFYSKYKIETLCTICTFTLNPDKDLKLYVPPISILPLLFTLPFFGEEEEVNLFKLKKLTDGIPPCV